jgi:hypothetical protein
MEAHAGEIHADARTFADSIVGLLILILTTPGLAILRWVQKRAEAAACKCAHQLQYALSTTTALDCVLARVFDSAQGDRFQNRPLL